MKKVFCILLFGFVCALPVRAAQPDYMKWFKTTAAQLRTAATYLRTGNTDFAALELENLVAAKAAPLADKNLAGIVAETKKTAQDALDKIDAGDAGMARTALIGLREKLFLANEKNGVVSFEDCIWRLVKKGPDLWHFKKNPPDFANQQQVNKAAGAALVYLEQLNKCDKIAGPEVKANVRYRRLVDGARMSLERLPKEALAGKNKGLLYRFIIELRSIDRLLYFRFG